MEVLSIVYFRTHVYRGLSGGCAVRKVNCKIQESIYFKISKYRSYIYTSV